MDIKKTSYKKLSKLLSTFEKKVHSWFSLSCHARMLQADNWLNLRPGAQCKAPALLLQFPQTVYQSCFVWAFQLYLYGQHDVRSCISHLQFGCQWRVMQAWPPFCHLPSSAVTAILRAWTSIYLMQLEIANAMKSKLMLHLIRCGMAALQHESNLLRTSWVKRGWVLSG